MRYTSTLKNRRRSKLRSASSDRRYQLRRSQMPVDGFQLFGHKIADAENLLRALEEAVAGICLKTKFVH